MLNVIFQKKITDKPVYAKPIDKTSGSPLQHRAKVATGNLSKAKNIVNQNPLIIEAKKLLSRLYKNGTLSLKNDRYEYGIVMVDPGHFLVTRYAIEEQGEPMDDLQIFSDENIVIFIAHQILAPKNVTLKNPPSRLCKWRKIGKTF